MPSPEFHAEFARRGGKTAAQCNQCATCSSVCQLAPSEAPFPRRQILWAQWGLVDRLAADPGPWLCHQCNDCNLRCPRDAQPGDVMQTVRAMVVEHLAFPSFLGRFVGKVRSTWPWLMLLPIVFWLVLLGATTGLHIPEIDSELPSLEGQFHYEEFVPHLHIYVVYVAASLWVVVAGWVSGRRFWVLLGANEKRHGSFFGTLPSAIVEIATHRRFVSCSQAGFWVRRWGHFLVMWGFIGAALTSGFAVLYLYQESPLVSWIPLPVPHAYPVPLDHWVKWLGNVSALSLMVGGVMLIVNRVRATRGVGITTAFDRFFLWTVVTVVVTGALTEAFRFVAPPIVACSVYLTHLGVVLTLFVTLPYSKFAHILYRTLAMVHQSMVQEQRSRIDPSQTSHIAHPPEPPLQHFAARRLGTRSAPRD
jgi:quinone-modifying oxidoreductase subunit QmoC